MTGAGSGAVAKGLRDKATDVIVLGYN